jgi:hypothetical protein
MRKSGGAAILMPLSFERLQFLYPQSPDWEGLTYLAPLPPFNDQICALLANVSQVLLTDSNAKSYPDVITFAFWCRKANLEKMKRQHDHHLRLGRGVILHITPANVPVNFAYSLAAGLLSGNSNIVRVPSQAFPQIAIIIAAFKNTLDTDDFGRLTPYLTLVSYQRDAEINAFLSALCDVRIVWGGDQAIHEIRRAPLHSRAFDVTFADRYSVCAIEASRYLQAEDPGKIARDFYNDTYLWDQNACTAPHLVIWTGAPSDIAVAQERFWTELHQIVARQYSLPPVRAVDKLTALYKLAIDLEVELAAMPDNLIVRVKIKQLTKGIENYRCFSGYFLEYAAQNLAEIAAIVNRKYQTLAYYGFEPQYLNEFLFDQALSGFDRIVPIGKTLDFSLVWDGYDLITTLSRKVDFWGSYS